MQHKPQWRCPFGTGTGEMKEGGRVAIPSVDLVERDPHLFQWYRLEVVQVNRAGGQLWLAVWWHQLTIQIRTHREFCMI
jgi:hypothetical protein